MIWLKFKKRNTRNCCKTCPKLTLKTTEQCQWCRCGVLLLLSTYFTLFCVSFVDFEWVNVSWIKNIQKKKSYYEITLGADVQWCSLKQVFWKISRKLQEATALESLFNKAAGPQQIFTGDCFSNLLELSMVFGPVKKSSENVHISLKTKSKHQVTYLKIQIISKCWKIKWFTWKLQKQPPEMFCEKRHS